MVIRADGISSPEQSLQANNVARMLSAFLSFHLFVLLNQCGLNALSPFLFFATGKGTDTATVLGMEKSVNLTDKLARLNMANF